MNYERAGWTPDWVCAPRACRRLTRLERIRGTTLLFAVLLLADCGRRLELVPLPQIGHLSDDAVMASDSGVTLIVRTDAWPGGVGGIPGLVPVEITIDNRSGRPLRIDPVHFALIQEDRRSNAIAPTDAQEPLAAVRSRAAQDVVERALPSGVLDTEDRVTGFVYFPQLSEAGEVTLVVDLVDSSTDTEFGVMRIAFAAD